MSVNTWSARAGPGDLHVDLVDHHRLAGRDVDDDAIVLVAAAAFALHFRGDRRARRSRKGATRRAPRARCAPAAARRTRATGRPNSCSARTIDRRARWRGCPRRRRALRSADPAFAGDARLRQDEREQRDGGEARARVDLQGRHDTALGGKAEDSNESPARARGFRAAFADRQSTFVRSRSARVQTVPPLRRRHRSGVRRCRSASCRPKS